MANHPDIHPTLAYATFAQPPSCGCTSFPLPQQVVEGTQGKGVRGE
jgi:hypothetical protein